MMMNHQGSFTGMLQIGDDSINFSNLDSSINPSMYTEKAANETREKQFAKLQQQQQAILAAQQAEQQQRKIKLNFQSSDPKNKDDSPMKTKKKKNTSPDKRTNTKTQKQLEILTNQVPPMTPNLETKNL